MLERFCPALYGWLVWGGGFHFLSIAFRWAALAAAVLAIFMLGRLSA